MSELNLEFQGNIPILVLHPAFQYYPDINLLKTTVENEIKKELSEIIIDLSNFFEVNSTHLNIFSEAFQGFKKKGKKLGIIIPKAVELEGLKIKLIEEFMEIFDSRYDALYQWQN